MDYNLIFNNIGKNNTDNLSDINNKESFSETEDNTKTEDNMETEDTFDTEKYDNNEKINIDFLPSYTGKIINEFMIYYKNNYKVANNVSIFDSIDINNETSTNFPMEKLYQSLYFYNIYKNINKNLVNVYYVNDFCRIENQEIFAIKKNNSVEYLSHSLYAILETIMDLKNDDTENKYVIFAIIKED
jgi:hypothetical protein